jgi:predicted metalloenzyme YecM
MNPLKALIGDYDSFIQTISDGLVRCGVSREELSMMDHICYRVETEDRYQEMLESLKSIGTLLGENEVSGRMIATFELNEYLVANGWTVPYIELPAPKEGSPYAEGLEHAELVVVGSLERFMNRHKDLSFSLGGMSKQINPEAGLKAEGTSVKFHEQQLGAVVRIEQQLSREAVS